MNRFFSVLPLCSLCLCGYLSSPAQAQDKKKDEKKLPPQVKVVLPLGAAPGKTTKLTVRGHQLDKATDVKVEGAKVKIVSKGPAGVPDKNPDKVGDTQVVIELSLPDQLKGDSVPLVVVTPEGDTKPHPVLADRSSGVIAEKEPNEGFKQFHNLKVPALVEGAIDRPRDVDVYRFEGKAGQKVHAEIIANRHGSALDAMVTVFNAKVQQLAAADDFDPTHRDARLDVTLPADGAYFIVVVDAHDTGSAVHAYRLVVK